MGREPDKETINMLKEHLHFLKARFKPEKILLFGSRARGEHLKESDIDLIVVSSKFEGTPFVERMVEAYGMWNKKIDLEQICYTPAEFEKKKKELGIVRQAVKEGIALS